MGGDEDPDIDRTKRVTRWYFGGLASAGAACFTHPLDLLKVHLQTQKEGKISVLRSTSKILSDQGVLALYNGISASLCRQLSYSTIRFAIYETGKQALESSTPGESAPFYQRITLAALGGACGGLVGVPTDLVNVRMQNDVKLPANQRRNYKHVIDGLVRVYKEEGFPRMFAGASAATCRTALMAVGQISFYDQVKMTLLSLPHFEDNMTTYVLSSVAAGAVATTMTQPLDVVKTITMNAKPGQFQSTWDVVMYIAKLGPTGFFRGYFPAFVRLAPQTILTFLILEQLRLNFGFIKQEVVTPPQ